MIRVDGSEGEGGGQILRTALSLSLVTGRPFRIEKIRAHRKVPGLRRQHLAAVAAAARIGGARVEGADLGSTELTFVPATIVGGDFRIPVGSAGSAMLVLQTLVPALLRAPEPSRLTLEGGTHNPMAPPFDFVERCFLPVLARMGAEVHVTLVRAGFYPAGGGVAVASVRPSSLRPLTLDERGKVRRTRARALVAHLPRHVAEREIEAVRARLGRTVDAVEIVEVGDSAGPGNLLCLEIESEQVTEMVCAFGERGKPAERVAQEAVAAARRYLDAGVPVGEHLADQLLLPLALAGGGSFTTLPLTPHATTNAAVIGRFLGVRVEVQETGPAARRVTLARA